MPGVTIGAVYDPSLVRMEDFNRTTMVAAHSRMCRSFGEIISDETLDGLVIATPDHLHAAHAVAALEAGKPLFLEKPIATTLEDGRAIVGAARRTQLPLQVGFVLRYSGFFHAVRDEFLGGTLGELLTLDIADRLGVDHGASYRRRWQTFGVVGRLGRTQGMPRHRPHPMA